jgi:hypothetical protein
MHCHTRRCSQIERGFLMYAMGSPVEQGPFSRDVVGPIVGEYADVALRLSDRRWKKILSLCGAQSVNKKASLNAMSLDRRTMYQLSSPTRGFDDESE